MADVTRLHKLVRKADGLQDFQRAGLNASGTAFMGRPVVLIDNPAGDAMPIQLSRHEQARWTCAYHQYLGVTGHQVSPPPTTYIALCPCQRRCWSAMRARRRTC